MSGERQRAQVVTPLRSLSLSAADRCAACTAASATGTVEVQCSRAARLLAMHAIKRPGSVKGNGLCSAVAECSDMLVTVAQCVGVRTDDVQAPKHCTLCRQQAWASVVAVAALTSSLATELQRMKQRGAAAILIAATYKRHLAQRQMRKLAELIVTVRAWRDCWGKVPRNAEHQTERSASSAAEPLLSVLWGCCSWGVLLPCTDWHSASLHANMSSCQS